MKCNKFANIFNDKNTFHIIPMLYNNIYLTKCQSRFLRNEDLFKFILHKVPYAVFHNCIKDIKTAMQAHEFRVYQN